MKKNNENTTDREIVISRVIHAPREMVWNAWVDTEQVVKWWGPDGFTDITHKREVKPGGVWEHTMVGPDGTKYPNKSVFKEIVKPERIVFSHGGGKEDGSAAANFTAIWTFEEISDKQTKITGRMIFPNMEARDKVVKEFGAIEGGKQTLAKLAAYIEPKAK